MFRGRQRGKGPGWIYAAPTLNVPLVSSVCWSVILYLTVRSRGVKIRRPAHMHLRPSDRAKEIWRPTETVQVKSTLPGQPDPNTVPPFSSLFTPAATCSASPSPKHKSYHFTSKLNLCRMIKIRLGSTGYNWVSVHTCITWLFVVPKLKPTAMPKPHGAFSSYV